MNIKIYAKDYKNSDSLIQDIKKYFNRKNNVGVIGNLSPYSDKECFLCEFNHNDKLDIELMKEVNYEELKKFIINSCKFNNEKNTLTIKIKLEGFEELSKQLDALMDKCKELNKFNTTCSINNNFFADKGCDINDIAKELSENIRLCVMQHD